MNAPGHAVENAVYLRDYALKLSVIEKVYSILSAGKTCPECSYNPGHRTLLVAEWVAHVLEHELERRSGISTGEEVQQAPSAPPVQKGPTI